MSDASGVDFKMMQQIHMLGELTKGIAAQLKYFDIVRRTLKLEA